MSDFFDNNQNELEQTANVEQTPDDAQQEEESTVFSAPAEHKDKAPKKAGKKRLISIIAACLAVALLVGGTLAIIKLIPEMAEDEAPSSVFDDITVIDADSEDFSSVTVKNSNGEFRFVTQSVAAQSEDEKDAEYWTVEGVDYSKLSTSSMKSIITSAASLSATKKIEKDAAECGFDEPTVKVTVESKSNDPYTFIVGKESPDGLGYFLTVEGSDTVYLTSDDEFSDFQFSLLDLTDKTAIPATTFTVDTSENRVDDGAYAYFDTLVLSGKSYPQAITVINTPEGEDVGTVTPYMVTTPMKRFANTESLSPIVYLFSKETTVSGNYALDITDENLKLFGLDNPDVVITMTIKGESKSFKISKVDDSFCAVIYDGATMIRKVATSTLSFMDFDTQSIYNKSLCSYPRTNVANLKFTDSEGEVEFNITYEEDEDSNKTYHITSGDLTIDEENYSAFYKELLSVQCSSFDVDEKLTKPDSEIEFEFFSGNKAKISFYKANDTEYQYSINGVAMGKIYSSAYSKVVKSLKSAASGNKIS